MGKIIFDYEIDQSLSKKSNANDLSILIGVDRFSFLISDGQQHVNALKSYVYNKPLSPNYSLAAAIRDVCRTDSLLNLPYQSTRIGFSNTKNTIIPEPLFSGDQLAIYLKNIIDFPATDRLQADFIKGLQIRNVFGLNDANAKVLENFFPSAKLFHHQTAVLEGYSKLAAVLSGHQVFINVHDREVQVMAFVGKELLFNNVFPFQTPEDFIYYVLLVYHQFQLKPEIVPLTISGLLIKDSKIYHLLYRYIRLLNLVQSPDYYRFDDDLKQEDLHFYFDLYSLKLCE